MAKEHCKYAKGLIDFVNKSPSAFHAVESARGMLQAAGFKELRERDAFDLQPGGKYYFTRNKSSLIAFAVGGQYKKGNGFNIAGAHTDSPCPKLKPNSDVRKSGFLGVGVQLYGGGIWHSWFDRDLTIAGRVLVKDGDGVKHKLVHVTDRPIMRIPTLAIHLDRTVNEQFKFNQETNMVPVLATEIKAKLDAADKKERDAQTQVGRHNPIILDIIAKEAGVPASEVLDFELCVVDYQPACIGGAEWEFIFSPRLDNLAHTYCSTAALCEAASDSAALAKESNINMIVLFDHEEIGSVSQYGADSQLLPRALERIMTSLGASAEERDQALQRSFMVSADVAHAWHPNYGEKHEENHRVMFHKGPVIKINANQRYATTAVTMNALKTIAARNNIPIQELVVRNDSPCGSTIGPMSSANTGIRTVDIGNPILSMHSVREMCGTDDVKHCVDLCRSFFLQWTGMEAGWAID